MAQVDAILDGILGQTATEESCNQLIEDSELVGLLFHFLHSSDDALATTACKALINLSSSEERADSLHSKCPIMAEWLLEFILSEEGKGRLLQGTSMLLSNMTRTKHWSDLLSAKVDISQLIAKVNACEEPHIMTILANLSQASTVRIELVEKQLLDDIMQHLTNPKSELLRIAVASAVKNCCMDIELHPALLKIESLLSRLMYPLAGPEEFTELQNAQLPSELQYMESDKERDCSLAVRCQLVEALTQLCATRSGREFVWNNGTYLIIRELYEWEKDLRAKQLCMNLASILTKEEEEIGVDNIKDVNVPEDLKETFAKEDEEVLLQ